MNLYDDVAYELSQRITLAYSTSFSSSTKLFPRALRPHIYAIYGLVRIADEVVDTYRGDDRQTILKKLENEVYDALQRGYSANPIVHSFTQTARAYGIKKELIAPFFASMTMDVRPEVYTQKKYETYIYGSAEVIGLMCLRVFLDGDTAAYKRLEGGARALGSAYQKVNFLRDIAADYKELGRVYFPGVSFDTFNDEVKAVLIYDIENDFKRARGAIAKLPKESRRAVELSLAYYNELLEKLKRTPASVIKRQRIRVNWWGKTLLFWRALAQRVTVSGI